MTDPVPFRLLRSQPLAAAALGACLVVSGLLLASEAVAEPETEQTVLSETIWTEEAAYTYSVPVTRNESIWPIGTDLGMGRAAYYRSVSQYVHVNFTWTARDVALEGGMAQANLSMRLRGQDQQGRVLWEVVTPVSGDALGDPARGITVSGTLDLDAVASEIVRLTKELPLGDGIVNWTLQADVTYDIQTSEGARAGHERFEFPLALHDPRLYLPAPKDVTWHRAHDRSVVQESVAPAGWGGLGKALPAQALVLLGACTLAGGAWALRVDPGRGLSPKDAAWAREHARFAEWVTTASASAELGSTFVDLESLEELVRVAADNRARILLDAHTRIYYVPHALLTYRYARHARADPAVLP